MEYRIRMYHRQKGVLYLTPPFDNREDAETHLAEIVANNIDRETVYSVVYGNYYSQGAENGTFAEFPEPIA